MPNLWCLNGLVWLLPKVDFCKFVIIPAIADDTMLVWLFAGKVVGLRGTGDCRKRRVNRVACPSERNLRIAGVVEMSRGSTHDIEDSSSFHGVGRIFGPGRDDRLLAAGLTIAQFVIDSTTTGRFISCTSKP
ncbi:MAG: hypothetical protein CM1200mP29_14950 [Verrucomicrobiota bacterium]|nr:MAG: hypothetical protein CM1200mP29_14950 [Verrucomicrobiota bacterium]